MTLIELLGLLSLREPLASLPESPDDPRVIDVDRDGRPGLTVTLSATDVAYHMYVVQRACQALELRPVGDGLEGIDRSTHGAAPARHPLRGAASARAGAHRR